MNNITEDILVMIKESFEEQKGIKVLSLFVEDNRIHGIYILPLQQSLSFQEEPLLDMITDIDGTTIIMEELGQLLLFAYKMGSIHHFMKLTHPSDIEIDSNLFNDLVSKCVNNPPLHLIDKTLVEWFERTDEVHPIRTKSFVESCKLYNQLDELDVDMSINTTDNDGAYILQQFRMGAQQLKQKKHRKISELTIYGINMLYIELQVDLYMIEKKNNAIKM